MKRRKSPLKAIFLLLLLLILCAAGIFGYKRYMPTSERADLGTLYEANGDEVTVFLNYEKQKTTGIYEDGQTYLPVDWVNDHLNERFYWDDNEKILVYALPEEVVTADSSTTGAKGQKVLLEKGDRTYLALGLILNYTDVRMNVYDSGEHKRVYIQNTWSPVSVATIKYNGKLRVKGGVKSPVITDLLKGESAVVLETMDKWAKVMTVDGHIGYMVNSKLDNLHEETPVSSFEEPVYRNISLDEKISMVWHQVTIDAANNALEELMSTTQGVNVIVPTWFTMSDNEGNYESLASKSYVEKAHAMGLQVWAMVDNFSRECSKNVQSEVLLSKTSVRKKLIKSLMNEADTYGFDGINLDFESLKESAGVHYIQFIRELSVACRNKGLVLSVDNYVPAPYNYYYNRKEQGIVADYVIIMGYDEHYAGGDAGSVSSLGYVEKGIKDTLELVPKEKIINGVPFYTRLWTKKNGTFSSRAMGIGNAGKWAEENGMDLKWDDSTGQYYGECETEDGMNYLWMEDARSLKLKMDLIKKYDLAGVSGWKLGLETEEIWDEISWK